MPLTAPRVPTGMKAGVSIAPWAVVSRPLRAWPQVVRISNFSPTIRYHSDSAGEPVNEL